MSSAYDVRYTLPNPILGGGNPQFWMIEVAFVAVVSINDQQAFAAKTGTEELDPAFKKWIPVAAVTCQGTLGEAAMTASSADDVLARRDELAGTIETKLAKLSEDYGLTVHKFEFETFGRPADEANRLGMMGFA